MMDVIKPVIVIPAYNRANSLERLLCSLDRAYYPEVVMLYISLEGGATSEVKQVAHSFTSTKLEINVIQRMAQLGLKNHILTCGDLAKGFGSFIMLEDDLIVDRYFYHYAIASLHHYADDESIAGISLYAQEYNEYALLPYKPMVNGYSTYPMQIPCSWGQCWTSRQWTDFRTWYTKADNTTIFNTDGLPKAVKGWWEESSWKKFFSAYLVRTNRSFIYPYQSYTSNCADYGGTHIMTDSDSFQVSFACQTRPIPRFTFCPTSQPEIAYDSFMEPCGYNVYDSLGLKKDEVEIDTLGIKPISLLKKKKYLLTCRQVTDVITGFPRVYRPLEHNLSYPCNKTCKTILSLVRSTSVTNTKKHKIDLAAYSYYTGLNMDSWRVAQEVIKALLIRIPKHIMRKVTKSRFPSL